MSANKTVVLGGKESFLIRVLLNKLRSANQDCAFVPWAIDAINAALKENVLVTLFLDDGEKPPKDVLHFLSESMEERGLKLILIGEQEDIRFGTDHIKGDLIYQTFTRPVDNAAFLQCVSDYFEKAKAGEFKRSILIVDDDVQYLSMVREWLKETYKVTMANSGLQAIKLLGKNKVDLILLDHEMPVTSGPQVLEMLRNDPETMAIPVMFLTGKGDKQSVMAVVALRPEGYFLKTIQKEELLAKLQEYFVLHR